MGNTPNKIAGKVAIVTGGSRGIGKVIALLLAKEGANIVIAARNVGAMKATCGEIKKLGVDCLAIKTDVSKSSDVKKLVKQVIKKFKRIDILVNNAGIAIYKPLIEMSEAEWDATLDTNLKAQFLLMKEVLPTMEKQKSGTIINISSGLGRSGYPGLAAYSASKFGVLGLTESTAMELQDTNIRVYAVLPGGVNTDMYHTIAREEARRKGQPYDPSQETLLKPEHIAAKVLMLCLPNHYPSGSAVEVYK